MIFRWRSFLAGKTRTPWLFALTVAAVTWLSVGVNADTPLADYRARVGQAVKTVEKANDEILPCGSLNKSWTPTLHLGDETRNFLKSQFPATETVTIDAGRSVQVENRAILALLNAQENADDCATSFGAMHRLADLLKNLDEQLAKGELPDPASAGKRASIADILSRPEFQTTKKEKTPFEKMKEWLAEKLVQWLSRVAPGADVKSAKYAAILRIVLYVALGVGLVWLGWILYRRFLKREPAADTDKGRRVILGEVLDEKTTVEELMAEAAKYAQAGDYRQAIRKVYIALLYDMDKREVIRIEPSLTNREYLRAVRAQVKLYPPMRDMTDRFDLVWYGQGTVGVGEYEEFVARYREATVALPTAA
jgi:hypothetical protein